MAEYITKSGIKLKGVIPPKSEDPKDFWKALNEAREFFRARPKLVEEILNERKRQHEEFDRNRRNKLYS
jgi:hypothetical protein